MIVTIARDGMVMKQGSLIRMRKYTRIPLCVIQGIEQEEESYSLANLQLLALQNCRVSTPYRDHSRANVPHFDSKQNPI